MDTILGLFGDYGPKVLAWVLVALGGLIGTHLLSTMKNQKIAGILGRAYDAVRTAVLEVAQTYADEIKKGSADGKLTPEERVMAKRAAIDKAKSYLGSKGVKQLAKVIGLDVDNWFGGAVERTVKETKLIAGPAPLPQ